MESEKRRAQKREYKKNNVKRISIEFYGTDSDVLSKLDTIKGKGSYIKGLIRKDIAKEKSE